MFIGASPDTETRSGLSVIRRFTLPLPGSDKTQPSFARSDEADSQITAQIDGLPTGDGADVVRLHAG